MSKLYATADMAKAIKGAPGKLDGLLQSSAYRNMLQFKVATQFGKTVLSPATQVRNVTSANMFPLANGHIGGRASVTESIKMVMDDDYFMPLTSFCSYGSSDFLTCFERLQWKT